MTSLTPAVDRLPSTMARAAYRTAAVVVLSATEFLAAVAANSRHDRGTQGSWLSYLPSVPALFVFAALTGALALGTRWARTATVIACLLFSLLTTVVLIIEIVIAGPSFPHGGAAYFRCGVAVTTILVYLTLITMSARPTDRSTSEPGPLSHPIG